MKQQRRINLTSNIWHLRSEAGFTMVEILLTMVMVVLVMVVGMVFWNFIQQNYFFSLEGTQSVVEVNDGIRRIVNELREARDAESGAYLLEIANDNEIAFYSDIDADLETERVRYWLDGVELKRGVIEPVGLPAVYDPGTEVERVVADDVEQEGEVLFTYYNELWPGDQVNNPIPQADRLVDTRYVEVSLRLNLFDERGTEPVRLEQGVYLRNAKTN